jgi:hypothetical protein
VSRYPLAAGEVVGNHGFWGARPHFVIHPLLHKHHIATEYRGSRARQFPRRRFYRGGFQISGLQTLWSHPPFSISCNVALGDPKELRFSG